MTMYKMLIANFMLVIVWSKCSLETCGRLNNFSLFLLRNHLFLHIYKFLFNFLHFQEEETKSREHQSKETDKKISSHSRQQQNSETKTLKREDRKKSRLEPKVGFNHPTIAPSEENFKELETMPVPGTVQGQNPTQGWRIVFNF